MHSPLGWLKLLAPVTSICAPFVLGLAYAVVLIWTLGFQGESRDLGVFVVGAFLLAPICSLIQVFVVRPDIQRRISSDIETVNCWAAVALLLGLSSLPLAIHVGSLGAPFWFRVGPWLVVAVAILHIGGLVVAGRGRWISAILSWARSRSVQAAIIAASLFVAALMLFRIEPTNGHLNAAFALFVAPPLSPTSVFAFGGAFMLAVIAVALVAAIAVFESTLLSKSARVRRRASAVALVLTFVAVPVAYMDYSLSNDVLHYLTNVGPALHLRHGGQLLVDTFSQYGPGPVLAAAAGFAVGPQTFGTAQLVTQFFNLLFYCVWLLCLSRMTRWKIAGLAAGFLVIGVFFAAWGRGHGNVNEAPSILALRYLPTLLMVAAISHLRPPHRHSLFTVASAFLSGLWSIETLISTVAVHCVFLGFAGLRDRALVRLLANGLAALLPAMAAVVTLAFSIKFATGHWPDYGLYLQYLSFFNPTAQYWTIPADPLFFGWFAMLLAAFVVFSDAWARVFSATCYVTATSNEMLFYRYVPMAALLLMQGAYYVARSVDYTLVMAFFPFFALVIPAAITAVAALSVGQWPAKTLIGIPVIAAMLVMTFTFHSVLREDSPYSLFVHECRDLGRCTPASLIHGLGETLHVRSVLERVRRPAVDGWYDETGVVRDAVSVLAAQTQDVAARPTVLLGRLRGDLTANEFALMYTDQWDRWPRSDTLTDELIPALAKRIIDTPIKLHEGDLVLVRRDESRLGVIDSGILRRVRAESVLCQQQNPSPHVVVFRVAGAQGCAVR